MKKFIMLITVISLLLFSGCSKKIAHITAVEERGKLRVGVKSDVPNFGHLNPDTKKYEGLEIDIAKSIAKAITGDENAIEFLPVTAMTRDTMLENDEIDLIIATFTITEERKETRNFSQPYYTDEIGFLVKKDSGITSVNDMSEKILGVTRSSTAYNELEGNTVKDVSISRKDYASYPEIKNALSTGKIDVFAADKSILYGYLDDDTVLLDDGFKPQPYGIATKLDDKPFSDYVDKHLQSMKDDGSLDKIINSWLSK